MFFQLMVKFLFLKASNGPEQPLSVLKPAPNEHKPLRSTGAAQAPASALLGKAHRRHSAAPPGLGEETSHEIRTEGTCWSWQWAALSTGAGPGQEVM